MENYLIKWVGSAAFKLLELCSCVLCVEYGLIIKSSCVSDCLSGVKDEGQQVGAAAGKQG